MAKKDKIKELKTFVREPFTFPGGYTKVMLADDGIPVCHKCVKEEFRNVLDSTRKECQDGWAFEAVFINWEDKEMYCGHCSNKIPSEYGDDEEPQDEQPQEEQRKHLEYEEGSR